MRSQSELESLYKKLRASPHWRDDFRIEEVKDVGGITVYFVKADDQEPATILSLVKLNEVLQS